MALSRCLAAGALACAATAWPSARAPQVFDPASPLAPILAAYRGWGADAAVAAFADWPESRVEAWAAPPRGAGDPWTRAALALLHTEAGFRKNSFGSIRPEKPWPLFLGGWTLERAFEVHSHTASRLIDELYAHAKDAGDAPLLEFARRWYVLTVSYSFRSGRTCLGSLMTLADSRFGREPEMLLLVGSVAERLMGPREWCPPGLAGQPPIGGTLRCVSRRHGNFGPERQAAEWSLRRALKLDPGLVEARLRLGRVLHLLGIDEESAAELEHALADARAGEDAFVAHLAALFLGELHEEADRPDLAERFYREAIAEHPGAQTAWVALGQLLVRTGDPAEGWRTAERMFDAGRTARGTGVDPWSVYGYAQDWQRDRLIARLREMVRQP